MVFEHQKTLSVACCTGPYLGSDGPGAGAGPSHVGHDGADGDAANASHVRSDGPGAGAGPSHDGADGDAANASHVRSDGPGAGAGPSHVGLDGADDVDVGSDGPGPGAAASVISPAGELKSGLVLSLK